MSTPYLFRLRHYSLRLMFVSPDKLLNYLHMTHTAGVDQHARIVLRKSHVFVHSTST